MRCGRLCPLLSSTALFSWSFALCGRGSLDELLGGVLVSERRRHRSGKLVNLTSLKGVDSGWPYDVDLIPYISCTSTTFNISLTCVVTSIISISRILLGPATQTILRPPVVQRLARRVVICKRHCPTPGLISRATALRWVNPVVNVCNAVRHSVCRFYNAIDGSWCVMEGMDNTDKATAL